MRRTTFLPSMLAMVLICLGACASTPTSSNSNPSDDAASRRPNQNLPVLRVGVSRSAAPLMFGEGDDVLGLEADMALELGSDLGYRIEYVPMYWPNLIVELRSGHIDIIMSGMSVTDARSEHLAFSQPYMSVGQQALIRRVDMATLGSPAMVVDTRRRVAVEVGTTAAQFVRTKMPQAKLTPVATFDAGIEALTDEKIAVVVHDSPLLQYAVSQMKNDSLYLVPGLMTQESLAWGVAKDNRELLAKVNGALMDWKSSGKLDSMIARWLTPAQ